MLGDAALQHIADSDVGNISPSLASEHCVDRRGAGKLRFRIDLAQTTVNSRHQLRARRDGPTRESGRIPFVDPGATSAPERWLPSKQKLRLSGAFLRADARTRTGDPFI